MYILQRRESENSLWHTCSYKGRKCKFQDIAKARIAFRAAKNSDDFKSHPGRELRILDSETDKEVK